jgi:hypothetical protein
MLIGAAIALAVELAPEVRCTAIKRKSEMIDCIHELFREAPGEDFMLSALAGQELWAEDYQADDWLAWDQASQSFINAKGAV